MSSKFGRKLLADLQQASDKFSIFSLDSTYLSTFFDAADDVGDDAETRTPENVSKSKFQNFFRQTGDEQKPNSVTRLGDFSKFWETIFFTKVAQILGDFQGYFEKLHF